MKGLEGYTLSRRDDLESLGYTIMDLIDNENIPWNNTPNNSDILSLKRAFLENDTS
jgi:hypothetical protein